MGPAGLWPALTLRGSQVCSALRRLCRLGLAFGHPYASVGRSSFWGARGGAALAANWSRKARSALA
nr:hypothetical protein [Saprospira grandis]